MLRLVLAPTHPMMRRATPRARPAAARRVHSPPRLAAARVVAVLDGLRVVGREIHQGASCFEGIRFRVGRDLDELGVAEPFPAARVAAPAILAASTVVPLTNFCQQVR